MIVYMLRGEPAWQVKRLGDELADVFTLDPASAKIGPHLTLKAPFETNSERNVEELKAVLVKFATGRPAAPVTYDGFGQFDKRVVFVYVKPSAAAAALTTELTKTLRTLPWIKFTRTDGEKHMHATLCYVEKRSQFDEIKKYLAGETVKMDGTIDAISLLVQEKDYRQPWKLLAEYSFAPSVVMAATDSEL